MAISVQIYSNANSSSKVVTYDFVGDVLAASDELLGVNTASTEYYFRITTGATQDDNTPYEAKVARSLSELVLNGVKQSATDTNAAYSDVKSMIVDYTYDYINGHTADQYSSGVTEQKPMKF